MQKKEEVRVIGLSLCTVQVSWGCVSIVYSCTSRGSNLAQIVNLVVYFFTFMTVCDYETGVTGEPNWL